MICLIETGITTLTLSTSFGKLQHVKMTVLEKNLEKFLH